jgi:hypothetical protein
VVDGNYTAAAFLLLQAGLAAALAYRMHLKTQHKRQDGDLDSDSFGTNSVDAENAVIPEKVSK